MSKLIREDPGLQIFKLTAALDYIRLGVCEKNGSDSGRAFTKQERPFQDVGFESYFQKHFCRSTVSSGLTLNDAVTTTATEK